MAFIEGIPSLSFDRLFTCEVTTTNKIQNISISPKRFLMTFVIHPSLHTWPQTNIDMLFVTINQFVCSRMSYNWNHILYDLHIFLVKYFFKLLSMFLLAEVSYWVVRVPNLNTSPLEDICIMNIFSHSVSCLVFFSL